VPGAGEVVPAAGVGTPACCCKTSSKLGDASPSEELLPETVLGDARVREEELDGKMLADALILVGSCG